MISVVDPQKKLTTTLLLRPKQWLGTNVPYNNIGLDPCRVAAKEKRKRYTEKSSFFRKFDTGIIVEHKKDQNISMKVMGIDGATISHSTGPELTGIVKVASAFQNLYRNRQSNTIRLPLNW